MDCDSNTLLNTRYNFILYLPVTGKNLTLIAEQLSNGLQVSLKTTDNTITPVQKHLIEGLPKSDFVPIEFFDSCYIRLAQVNSGVKIYLCQRGKGGGIEEFKQVNKDIQRYIKSITVYYHQAPALFDEAPWNERWAFYNKDLAHFLQINPDYAMRKHYALANLEQRIAFSRQKREVLSAAKEKLAQIAISIHRIMGQIDHLISMGLELQGKVCSFSSINTFNTSKLEFQQTQSLARQIAFMENTVTSKIMDCDQITNTLDRLYVKLKTNVLQANIVNMINFPRLQQVLMDEKSVELLIDASGNLPPDLGF